jgi:hypothetical protein
MKFIFVLLMLVISNIGYTQITIATVDNDFKITNSYGRTTRYPLYDVRYRIDETDSVVNFMASSGLVINKTKSSDLIIAGKTTSVEKIKWISDNLTGQANASSSSSSTTSLDSTTFDSYAQIAPVNAATVTINYQLKEAVYQSIIAPATMTLAYSNARIGSIHHIAIAPVGASSIVTFAGFVENAATVTTKTFTAYTVLTIKQLSTTSAEIVNIYNPALNVTTAIPQGVSTVASALLSQTIPITNGITPNTNTDITHLEIFYQIGGAGTKLRLIPTIDFALTSIVGNDVNITLGSTPSVNDKFYILIK